VVAVLVYHASLGWLKGGFLGVEVFFVISGYLITLLLVSEHEKSGGIGFRRFWFRRARRLLPAVYMLLLVVSITVVLFVRDQALRTRGDVIAGLTYTTNWYLISSGTSYFDSFGRPPMLRHLWSLAVEEQFYLVWPLLLALLLWACKRRPERMAIPMLALVAGSTLLMAALYNPVDPSSAYYSTATRAGGLVLGAVLALFWRPAYLKRGAIAERGPTLDVVGIGGLVVLAFIMMTVGDQDAFLYRGGFLIVGLATVACIAMATHPKSKVAKVLGLGPILWIGTRSYSIYLWHWPVYVLTRPGIDVPWSPGETFAVRLILTGALAEISYRVIERPIRNGAIHRWFSGLWRSTGQDHLRRLRRTRYAAIALAGAVLIGGVGLASAKSHAGEVEQSIQAGEAALSTQTTVATDAGTTPSSPSTTAATDTTAVDPAIVAVPSVATTTIPPTTTNAPTTIAQAIPAIAIGDSVMLGAAPELKKVLGDDSYVDAHVGRQFKEAVGMIDSLAGSGKLGPLVILHLGNNGTVSASTVDDVLDRLGNVPKVIVVNVRVDRDWQDSVNATLAARVPVHRNAVLLDWFTASANHPEYFYDDGTHLRPAGAAAYAAFIQAAMG